MLSNSKRNLLFITLLLMILLISSAYTFVVPTVNAAELDLQEKAVSVLSDVVGLETEQYTTSHDSTQQDSEFRSYPQIETSTYLASEEGSLRVTCSYVKDTLKLVYLSDVEGEYSLKQPAANTVEMAKGLLERYQNYAGDSLYGELASMLDGVDANTNVTKLGKNMKLEVSDSDQTTVSYTWTYVDNNGVLAERKNVILTYEQGQLKGFFNNWPLYTIVDTTPKLSSEEATAIAIDASEDYTYPATAENGTEITVSGFTIASESLGYANLVYVNNEDQDYARGGDPFKLYLAWHVPLGFDEFYPGDVSGMTVILWADTGEVCGMTRVITDSGLASSENTEADAENEEDLQTVNQQSTILPVAVVIAALIVMVSLVTCKRAKLAGAKLSLKLWTILLCATIISSAMLFTVPDVSAADVIGKSRVYACVDTELGYQNETADDWEEVAAAEVCNFVGNASLDAGYITSNQYGSWGTTATNVVNNAGSDEQSYLNTMVYHSGHLYGFNDAYQDNDGNPITAEAIYAQTESGRHFFVFIWVCNQGMNPQNGSMAAAWTHRDGSAGRPILMSSGFGNPDGYGQCYISFDGYSPMLSAYYAESGWNSTFWEYNEYGEMGPCSYFIMKFYYYALYEGYSVHDSLDIASNEYFGCNYLNSRLNLGYNCWWPGGDWTGNQSYLADPGYYPMSYQEAIYNQTGSYADLNRMRVFGDSSIKLCQSYLTLSGVDDSSNPLSPVFTIDGETENSGSCRLVSKSYDVGIVDLPNYDFSYFSYNGENYYDLPSSILLDTNGTLTAHFTWDPVYYDLSISSSSGGYTTPSGTQEYLSYTDAEVQAIPDNDSWIFDHWLLDGEDAGMENPITVTMDDDYTLQAVFTTAPSYKFVTSINDYNQYATNPQNLIGWKNDSQFAELVGYGPYQYYGWIEATLNSQATGGHIYMYGCCASGYEGHLYVYVSNDGNNWNLVSTPYVSATSPYWIDCGLYENNFNYIKVTVENTGEFPWIGIDSVRVEPIAYYDLTISAGTGGTTDPSPGVHEYQEGTQVQVTADADDNYVFDHWLLDGNTYTQNPITFTMNDDRTLQAFFTYAPSHYWASSINDYGGPVTNPTYLLGSETDGQYAGLVGYGPYQYYGWIEATMDSQATGHIYMYGCAASAGHLYVYVSSNGNSWSLVGSPYVSSSSPYWIDCGTYQSTFNYIAITVENPSEWPNIGIDAVRVEP